MILILMPEFLKVGFWTSISTFARILSYLVIVKLIALYTGPEGLGKMGQFMSLMTIVSVCAGGGIANGIIRYVAEYTKTNPDKIITTLNAGSFVTLITSFVFFIGLSVFASDISWLLLKSTDYSFVIRILSVAQFCIAFNNYLMAIINGQKDVKTLVLSNVCGACISVIVSYFLISSYSLFGVLLSLIFAQACLVFLTLFFIRNKPWFTLSSFKPIFDKAKVNNLFHYSLMAIAPALLTPIAHIIIRDHIVGVLSWTDAGYWQAITKISDVYLLFLTTAMTMYYLPKLSELLDEGQIKKEILATYKILLPAVCILSFSIYILRDLVIYILFDSDFTVIRDLFFIQLLGDIVKISSWVLSFLMLAKKKTKLFLSTEIIFSTSYVFLTIFLVNQFSLIGAMYAFLINCSVYLIVMGVAFYSGGLTGIDRNSANSVLST